MKKILKNKKFLEFFIFQNLKEDKKKSKQKATNKQIKQL